MSFQSKLDALPLKPMTAGEAAHFEHSPCFRCGYNSHDYYHTAYHKCAQAYHAFKNSDAAWLYARLALAREFMQHPIGCGYLGVICGSSDGGKTWEETDHKDTCTCGLISFLAKLDSEGL